MNFCYVATPDPLFAQSLYQSINTGDHVFTLATLTETNAGACETSFTYALATANADMSDSCTTSPCSWTLHTDGIAAVYEHTMTITVYRSGYEILNLPDFTVHVIDCASS